MITFATRNFID